MSDLKSWVNRCFRVIRYLDIIFVSVERLFRRVTKVLDHETLDIVKAVKLAVLVFHTPESWRFILIANHNCSAAGDLLWRRFDTENFDPNLPSIAARPNGYRLSVHKHCNGLNTGKRLQEGAGRFELSHDGRS